MPTVLLRRALPILSLSAILTCSGPVHRVPDGRTVSGFQILSADDLRELLRAETGRKAVLVNVWATWCAPCVEEFPLLVKLQNAHRDRLRVIFISADFPESDTPVAAFLREQGVDWPAYAMRTDDQEFMASLADEWTGALPATAIYGRGGGRVAFWEGAARMEEFEKYVTVAFDT